MVFRRLISNRNEKDKTKNEQVQLQWTPSILKVEIPD